MAVTRDELYNALRKYASEEFAHVQIPDHEFSKGFEKKMNRVISKYNSSRAPMSLRRKIILTVAATLILLSMAVSAFAYISSNDLRYNYTYDGDDYMVWNDNKYFRQDKYGYYVDLDYRITSPLIDKKRGAIYVTDNDGGYEREVKLYEDNRYMTFGGSWLFDPLIFASEEIVNLPYLEDYSLCEKIMVEIEGHPDLKDGEHETSEELKKAIYELIRIDTLREKNISELMGEFNSYPQAADPSEVGYFIYLFPKGTNASVEMVNVRIGTDVNGKIGIYRTNNNIQPLPDGFDDPEKFYKNIK